MQDRALPLFSSGGKKMEKYKYLMCLVIQLQAFAEVKWLHTKEEVSLETR